MRSRSSNGGPRFVLTGSPGNELSLHPFALANFVLLGNALDFDTFRGGAELDKAFVNDRMLLDGGYTYRYQSFKKSVQFSPAAFSLAR